MSFELQRLMGLYMGLLHVDETMFRHEVTQIRIESTESTFFCQDKREKYYFVVNKRANILGFRGECILPLHEILTNYRYDLNIICF